MQDSQNNMFYSPELERLLEEFSHMEVKTLNPGLLRVLWQVANTGLICYSWPMTRQLITFRLNQIFFEFGIEDKTFQSTCQSFINGLDSFQSPPFTIQRLCELILQPQTYKSPEKYLFAIEKLVDVATTEVVLNPTDYNQQVKLLIQQKQEVDEKKEDKFPTTSMETEDGEKMAMDVEVEGEHVEIVKRPDIEEW